MLKINNTLKFKRIIFFTLVTCISLFSAEDNGIDINNLKLGGYGYWEFGQIVNGEDFGGKMDNQWTNRALLGIHIRANPSERLQLNFSPEFKLYYPYPERQNSPVTQRPNNVAFINQMMGTFSLGDVDDPVVKIDLGMFPYKYNPDSRNLGEYLYRTGTYPQSVITDFDFAAARVLGARIGYHGIKNLQADLLFTSEYQYYPLYDFSLTGITSYTIGNALTLGAGVMLARLIPTDSKKTEPSDPLKYYNAQYITAEGDTAYYTFKATKLMFRASLDPLAFLPERPEFLGAEGLKIYTEAAVLGLKDYKVQPDSVFPRPEFYGDIKRRIPVMAGLNLPTHPAFGYGLAPLGILAFTDWKYKDNFDVSMIWYALIVAASSGLTALDYFAETNSNADVLAAEMEYFANGLPNDYRRVLFENIPVPNVSDPASYSPGNYKEMKWRWSFYAKKEIIKGFTVTGQIAYDHLRTTFQDGASTNDEALHKSGHWYWILKTGFGF